MKFIFLGFVLAIAPGRCLSQSAPGSFTFGSAAGSGSRAHFGLEAPTFPDTSGARLPIASPPAVYSPLLRSVYPVYPSPLASASPLSRAFGPNGGVGVQPLILVFRNQTIDATSACWIEGKMLHYVNSFDSAETVPVKRVNWKLTEETNSVKPGTLVSALTK